MSEYWVSTPTYWCKFCQTYVRDTKVARQQHEATGKHQGSVQRSIRQLQKTQDRESRESQRAKDEIARLKGVTSGSSTSTSSKPAAGSFKAAAASAPSAAAQRPATKEERFRQAEQLAEMGIAIPEEYRRDMAIAGEWETVSRPVKEEKKVDPLSIGLHKRKREEGEESEDDEQQVTAPSGKKAWGAKFKSLGAGNDTEDLDFDALLKGTEGKASTINAEKDDEDGEDIKPVLDADGEIKPAAEVDKPAVVFKKRKGKTAKT